MITCPCSFKEYIGSIFSEEYREKLGLRTWEERYGNSSLVIPFGISIVTLGADNKIIIEKRSSEVFAFPHYFHVKPSGLIRRSKEEVFNASDFVLEQAKDELAVEPIEIKHIKFTGLIQVEFAKIELTAIMQLHIQSQDVMSRVPDHAWESSMVTGIPWSFSSLVNAFQGKLLTPSGIGALELAIRNEFNRKWRLD